MFDTAYNVPRKEGSVTLLEDLDPMWPVPRGPLTAYILGVPAEKPFLRPHYRIPAD